MTKAERRQFLDILREPVTIDPEREEEGEKYFGLTDFNEIADLIGTILYKLVEQATTND